MSKIPRILSSTTITILTLVLFQNCASNSQAQSTRSPKKTTEKQYIVKKVEHGKASWYSIKTNYGTKTASGQRLSNNAATAAHKTLPMGTKVRVTNLNNKKSEIVTINDRGPYIRGRIIDVTIGTAAKLGFVKNGVAPVKVEVLKKVE